MDVEPEQPEESPSTADATSKDVVALFAGMASMLKDETWTKALVKELNESEGTFTPLDFAVMCQADQSAIQQLYELEPSHLTEYTLHLACKFGAKPGVVSFLVGEKPGAARLMGESYEDDDYLFGDTYPLSLAMGKGPGEGRPTEADIRSLVEAWPESVAVNMYWLPSNNDEVYFLGHSGSPIQSCILNGYCKNLMNLMLGFMPSQVEELILTSRVSNLDLALLDQLLPKTQSLFIAECSNGQHLQYWDAQTASDIFTRVFQNKSIRSWKMKLDYKDDVFLSHLKWLTNQASLLRQCPRIERLDVKFDHPQCHVFLDSLPFWPCLQHLTVSGGFDCEVLSCVLGVACKVIQGGGLQELRIIDTSRTELCDGRLFKATKQVVGAVAPNRSLRVMAIPKVANFYSNYESKIGEELVKALKQNTALQEGRGEWGAFDDEVSFYTGLNRCGRALARETSMSLEGFVALLGSTRELLDNKKRTKHYSQGYLTGAEYELLLTSIQYALLHEGLSKWANPRQVHFVQGAALPAFQLQKRIRSTNASCQR